MKWLIMLFAAAAAAQAPAKGDSADAAGKKLFAAKCASCHGKDGKGAPAMAKMFKVDLANMDLTAAERQKKGDAELAKVLTTGKNKMPSFKDKLKDAELASVLAYVRTLAPAAGKAEAKSTAKGEAKPEAKPETK